MVKLANIQKAAAHRARVNEVKAIVSWVKSAQDAKAEVYAKRRRRLMLALMTVLGAGIGAQNGALISAANGKKPGKGAAIGAGVGALGGLAAGAASNSVRGWAGVDPLLPTVAIAKT
jgi:uncharacterized protein YcfJ